MDNNINELRESLKERLEEYYKDKSKHEHLKLDIPINILEDVIFDYWDYGNSYNLFGEQVDIEKITNYYTNSSGRKYYSKVFTESLDFNKIIKYLDLTDVNFDGFDLVYYKKNFRRLDFTGSKGIKINPQTIHGKNLSYCHFSDVEFTGPFDECKIKDVDFTGSKGAKINPQTIPEKDLCDCSFSDAELIGPFDGCNIRYVDFTGSKGAVINFDTILYDIEYCHFCDAEIKGYIRTIISPGVEFKGSHGAKVNKYVLDYLNKESKILDEFERPDLSDVEIVEGIEGLFDTFINDPTRYNLIAALELYARSGLHEHLKFDIPKGKLEECIFDYWDYNDSYNKIIKHNEECLPSIHYIESDGKKYYAKVFTEDILLRYIISYLDLSLVNFDGFTTYKRFSFKGSKGVKINPQTIYEKDLSYFQFTDVEFTGPFDGCKIEDVDFTGSKGAKINPQTIGDKFYKRLSKCKVADVEFIGPFDKCHIADVNFKGSKGAKINPQTVYDKRLSECKFADVEFIGPFDECYISRNDFTGSKGAKINPQTLGNEYFKGFVDCKFTDVEFIGSFDECYINKVSNCNFKGSKGARINKKLLEDFKENYCINLEDVEIIDDYEDNRENYPQKVKKK